MVERRGLRIFRKARADANSSTLENPLNCHILLATLVAFAACIQQAANANNSHDIIMQAAPQVIQNSDTQVKHGHNFKDIGGQRFGRLTVLGLATTVGGKAIWFCRCDCGKEGQFKCDNLVRGVTKSCGCLRRDLVVKRFLASAKHTPGYRSWDAMTQRCYNPRNNRYKNYGARGISVCEEWRNDFWQFYKDMGPKPSPKHSIDRIDNSLSYCKSNCKWSTNSEQANNKTSSRRIELNGVSRTVKEWAIVSGLKTGALHQRLAAGWPIERALTTPIRATSLTPKLAGLETAPHWRL